MTDTARQPDDTVVGMVLVPRDDEARDHADSILPDAMIEAGIDALERVDNDHRNYTPGETPDWDYGMVAVAVYRAMLAAARKPTEPQIPAGMVPWHGGDSAGDKARAALTPPQGVLGGAA